MPAECAYCTSSIRTAANGRGTDGRDLRHDTCCMYTPLSIVNYTSVYAFSSRKSILKAAGGASVQSVYDMRGN